MTGDALVPSRQGGAGYIVTLSQTISTPAGTVAAVMGMDMTIGYFYQVRTRTDAGGGTTTRPAAQLAENGNSGGESLKFIDATASRRL